MANTKVLDFWHSRWEEGRHGWHEPAGNQALQKYWPRLPSGSRVLVPLCGKSVDLLWLAHQGCDVTGVELSSIAARSFFAESGLEYEADETGGFHWFRNPDAGIAIACGNYFDFSAAPFDALYDRAAFSALPPGKRPEYAQMTGELLKPGAARLLVTLEFDDSLVKGPPYPAWRDEVSALWPGLERVEARDDTPNAPPKFLEAGLDLMIEVAWVRNYVA
ncbi:MAG: thiopurine S-methyltransferase [Lysobacterales bacterium]